MRRNPRCPSCKIEVSRDNPFLPFCSERCRLLDLGRWLDGDYHVAGEKVEQKQESENQEPDGDDERRE
ncbi:MAG: DNA gyrase inhibitor YacG [Acidobacteria bacterium]|nr:MAG: DNA gyrase inhibitor YacG [Acidobacteriota bacterium]